MSTPVLDADTEVIVDEKTDDAPKLCVMCEPKEVVATRVPVCPNGHILLVRTTMKPGWICDSHASEWPMYLLHKFTQGTTFKCMTCDGYLTGTTIPIL